MHPSLHAGGERRRLCVSGSCAPARRHCGASIVSFRVRERRADVVQRLLQQTTLHLKPTHGGSAAAQRRSVSPVSILNLSLTFTAHWGSAQVHLQLETQSSGTHGITAQTRRNFRRSCTKQRPGVRTRAGSTAPESDCSQEGGERTVEQLEEPRAHRTASSQQQQQSSHTNLLTTSPCLSPA